MFFGDWATGQTARGAKKRSEQMVLGLDSSATASDGPVPMEIDRIESKGKHKGKGKSKDKNGQKGKSKGKSKSKDGKGKGKQFDQKGNGYGKNDSKGKGKGEPKTCFVCGRAWHFAKDCWQSTQVRQVGSDVNATSTAIQGSPTSSLEGVSSASRGQ